MKGEEGKTLLNVLRNENEWGRFNPTPSIQIKNKLGGVEPTLFASIHIKNEWGWVEPTLSTSIHVENEGVR